MGETGDKSGGGVKFFLKFLPIIYVVVGVKFEDVHLNPERDRPGIYYVDKQGWVYVVRHHGFLVDIGAFFDKQPLCCVVA